MEFSENKGRWFDYDEEVRFKLKYQVDIPNDPLEYFDLVCTEWEGVKLSDGVPLECNRENKKKLLNETDEGPTLLIWMGMKLRDMVSFADMETIKKKLMPGSDGQLTSQKQARRVAENV